MVKKGKAEKEAANELIAEQGPPGFKAYLSAIWQLCKDWLKKWKLLTALLMALLLVAAGTWVWAAIKDKAELTNDEIVIRVSRELSISGDPNPVILTVNDENKVSQPFLEGAKNGDKVLLYYKSGKSALFRPSEDKIIRSGTYTPPDAKIFIRKGTADDAKIEAAKDKLKDIENTEISSQDAGTKQDYDRTIVVNITDRYDEQAQAVADALGVELKRLPKGETVVDADILVIVGEQ